MHSEPRSLSPREHITDDVDPDALSSLTTELTDAQFVGLDTLSTQQLVDMMNRQDATVAAAVGRQADAIARAADVITARFKGGGRLIYVGAGTAGRIGILDASECPPTFGTDPAQIVGVIAGGADAVRYAIEGAEDDRSLARSEMSELHLTPGDVVVGISASGRTPYVLEAVAFSSAAGAATVGLACNSPSRLGALADIAIEVVVGPEIIAGSTRLKAGTAQKLVLNMLTTISMINTGRVFDNTMVDLRPTNRKLRARAQTAVSRLTGVSAQEALTALRQCSWSVKEAVFTIKTGLSAQEAITALRAHHGSLRRALSKPYV